MKELFFGFDLARDELNVIDQNHIVAVPIARTELRHVTPLNGIDQLVHETLCRDVKHPRGWVFTQDVVADGMEEMCFSKTGKAV